MYRWMNRHLGLGLEEPLDERPFQPLSREEMTVWTEGHPKPPSGDDYERSLLRWITEDSRRQIEGLIPADAEGLAEFRRVIGGAVDIMLGRRQPVPQEVEVEPRFERDAEGYTLFGGIVRNALHGEEVPVYVLIPRDISFAGTAVVWVSPQGKQVLLDPAGKPRPAVRKLLEVGWGIVGLDLLGQGEHTTDGQPIERNRLDPKRKEYAGYTYGYNCPLFSQRVHDILTVIAALRTRHEVRRIILIGTEGAGRWVAGALAQAAKDVDRAVVDTAGFRFRNLNAIDDPDFLPGAAKYLDLPGMLALAAPVPLLIASEKLEDLKVTQRVYQAAGAGERIVLASSSEPEKLEAEILSFLMPK
jgi:hypothetical protein